MAEFKLGRIRFVWKGTWTSGTQYLVDDVVQSGGKSYICVINHTSAGLFATDFSAIPTKWNVVSDGTRWVGNWTPTTYYQVGDQVKYGGLVYICKVAHTSATNVSPTYLGLEEDLAKWDLFATSFNWKSTWSTNTKYLVNDFVVYGGTTYVCKASHVSTNSATITVTGASGAAGTATLTFATQVIQPYQVGASITVTGVDPAGYNGTFTVTECTTSSVSFASAETGTFVAGGSISGPSNLGLEVDAANWDVFNQGIVYLGAWTNAGGVRYKLNDIVKYGPDLWICTTPHSSSTNFIADQSNWGVFLKGFEFESTWNVLTEYQIGDTVTYGGYSYIAKTNHVGSVPTASPLDWDVFTTGFNFRGDYLAGTDYLVGDVVRYGGYTYLATTDNTNQVPSNATYWSKLNNGIRWTNNATTYTGVAGTNISGTGANATFDVVRNNTVYTVTVNNGGTGYANGNQIKILGTAIGGLTPVNDLTITVTNATGGVIQAGGISTVGVSVTWKSGVAYVLGDVVLYGANSYICVQEHVAASGNRPDADTIGAYWNMLAAGAESASLTTTGDMFYYGPNGPTRLPIGTDGQVLRVSNGLPSWAYWGVVNNVVYVSNETGTDSLEAGWGLTLDKPWKTVRYACEQIEKGYLNRNACDLLEKNKQFVMKEITNWIKYTYTVNITASSAATNAFTVSSTANLVANMPIVFSGTVGGVTAGTTYYVKQVLNSSSFSISNTLGGNARTLTTQTASMTGTLSYNSTKCERDVGLLVDAVCYDIGHGGNEESTKAAKSYYTAAGNAYITSNFGTQLIQTVAAYNYLKILLANVLTNTAPAQNYQALNVVDPADQALQIIDASLTPEAGTAAEASALLTIVTDGLNAGSAIAIPAAVNAQVTISVKTGTYFEILPMVVPKNTAIVGDELRSTVISPAGAIASLANDKPKTISALNRIKAISSNIIQNVAVTPTSGNTQAQVTSLPAGNVGSSLAVTRVQNNLTAIYDIINNGLTGVPNFVIPDPTGYDVNYSNARQQILQNYAFIKADVSAFINNNYPAVWTALGATGQAKCQRDIGYLLDAIRYDITYGGNLQSLIAGNSYYSFLKLTIDESEKAATIAAYGHLRTIILNIAQKLAVTPQAGNATPQVTSGTGGSLAAAQFAQARVQDVIDWITNGSSPATITPSLAWVSTSLQAANTALQAAKAEIQTDAIGYVQKHHQYLSYDQDVCKRDVGIIVDALGYDLMFGSNFASIKCGMAYHRLTESAQLVVTAQKDAELGLINFLKYKARMVVSTGAVTQVGTIIDDITAYITGGVTPRFVWADPSTIVAGFAAAKNLIWENKEFIQADLIAWISANYPAVTYSQDACRRDVGYIVDALRYDLTYGGRSASKEAGTAYYSYSTLQIDAGDKAATLGAYGRLKTIVQALATDSVVTPTSGNTVAQIRGTAGSVAAQTEVGLLVDVITNIINNGLTTGVPRVTITTIATNNTFTTSAAHGLNVGDEVIPQSTANGLTSGTTYYVASIPSGTQFTLSATWGGSALATFTNGTGLSILAEITDNPQYAWVDSGLVAQATALGSARSTTQASVISYINVNYPTLNYDSATCSRDVGYIIDALIYDVMTGSNYRSVVAGQSYYRAAASKVVGAQKVATLAAFRYLKTLVKTTVSTNATALERVIDNMDFIINILDKGVGITPDYVGTVSYNNTLGTIKGAEVLRANKNFLAYEATAWITQSYGGTVTTTAATTNLITTSSAHNLTVGDPVVFSGTTFGGITAGTIYYVLTVNSTTTFTVTSTQHSTSPVVLSNGSGTATVRYSFDAVACRRDMTAYIDAIVYDLQWTGNYKSLVAANLYNNAVGGSLKSDMFYVRNATGVRNCTLSGLTGELSEENSYGTKRPTAGAYVSLDPGFGPADSRVWITSKSCYVQNVTTFGTGCTGGKIDGALHLGGNRSMVSNDFTQVLSDGIGIWCTGTNSVTELVSVFSYYGYAGYLAELGGKIRATNGNSSYGTYGVVAEGTDSYETPITATVDNRAFQAQIANTVTDGTNKILRFEYGNAGENYTNTVHTVNGSGFNATAIADEFRDGAVFETRVIDLNNGDGVGGTNYVSVANSAQSGTVGKITIAATDQALSSAYVGMRIQITAGTGVGQYANILTYNNGNKEALIYKESFASLTITNTTVTSNLITVASTATLYDNMPFYVTTAIGGLAANTLYYVRTGFTATQFTASTSPGGAAVTLSTASGSVTLLQAGWDHVVPGTSIANALDLTTAYIIEPRISYTAPGYTSTAKTVTSASWSDSVYAAGRFVAIANGSTTTNYSSDGSGWANAGALIDSTMKSVTFGGGQGATATALIGGLGGQGAVLVANLGVPNTTGAATADQVASVTIVNGGVGYTTPPVIVFTPVSGGSGAVATCVVRDGVIKSVTVTVPGSGYTVAPTVTADTSRLTGLIVGKWGKDYASVPTVTIDKPFSGTAWSSGGTGTSGTRYYYLNGSTENWYLATSSGTFTTSGPTHQSGTVANGTVSLQYIGTSATATANLTNQGVSSYTIVESGAGYTTTPAVVVNDASAKFVAISGTSNTTCYQTPTGLGTAWTAGGTLPATNFNSVTYGNGVYVAVGGTSSCSSSTNGTTWIGRTIPTLGAGTYVDVKYGAGYFVAISTSNNATAISTNGTTWVAGGNLPSSTTWQSLAYGNGRFVAIANGPSRTVAYSIDNGTTWTAVTPGLPSSQAWTKIEYGQGLFFAVATGTNIAATSPDGITWTSRTLSANTTWNSVCFGNPLNNPTWVALSQNTAATQVKTGATTQGRMRAVGGVITEVRMVEPGSGYSKGSVTATTTSTNLITVDNTTNLVANQPIEFFGTSNGGLTVGVTYYVISGTITATQFKVSATSGSATPVTLSTVAGITNMTYRAGPIVTVTDPNNVKDAALRVRLGDGALGNPSFSNRGTNNATASSTTQGDGYSDLYQASTYINVAGLYAIPTAGANVEFASIPGTYFKLVSVTNVLGTAGNYTAQFQINPAITTYQAPDHGNAVTTKLKYSQVRLTGHDFLYIGTGNYSQTNYPNVDITTAKQNQQELFTGGGRVFFTSTDQDGNFNVGNLFGVQQATGTATLNASAFNLSGLQSLQLGSVTLGIGSAIITQFSTDPYFTANSDNIVPTQRAIRAYITSQIGGGSSSLNVNTLTSGVVYIAGNSITTTTGVQINVNAKMNFTGGIDGAPVALGFFLQR